MMDTLSLFPTAGHMKTDGHLGRYYLKGSDGGAANVILRAVGHNLRRVLAWLSRLLRFILLTLCRAISLTPALKWAS
jgi:IS5 family transposase